MASLVIRRKRIDDLDILFKTMFIKSSTKRIFNKSIIHNSIENLYSSFNRLKRFKYPIWLKLLAAPVSDYRRFLYSNSSSYYEVYYIFLKFENSTRFVGVCFFTWTHDFILCLKYKFIMKWLRSADINLEV